MSPGLAEKTNNEKHETNLPNADKKSWASCVDRRSEVPSVPSPAQKPLELNFMAYCSDIPNVLLNET
jgi:hypothetical protein